MSTQYYHLQREERSRRRTVSDAIDVLAQDANFGGADIAEVRVGTLRLPSHEQVGLLTLYLRQPNPWEDIRRVAGYGGQVYG